MSDELKDKFSPIGYACHKAGKSMVGISSARRNLERGLDQHFPEWRKTVLSERLGITLEDCVNSLAASVEGLSEVFNELKESDNKHNPK